MAAAIPIVMTALSVATTVYSEVSASGERSDARKDQRRLLAMQAQQAREANEQRAADYEKRARASLATERSQRGASGISMAGSPLLTYFENAKTFEEDVARIKRTGELEQTALAQRGTLNKAYGEAEEEAGKFRVGQTLLTGASNIFSQGQKIGAW